MSRKQDKRLVNIAMNSMTRWERFMLFIAPNLRTSNGTKRQVPDLTPTIGPNHNSFEQIHDSLKESRNLKKTSKVHSKAYEMNRELALAGPTGRLPEDKITRKVSKEAAKPVLAKWAKRSNEKAK